jgi:CRP-like cAMP-binding protein
MVELDPFVLRRVLWLRQLRWLACAELADLVLVAGNLIEARHAAGALVLAPAVYPGALHLVVDGELAAGTQTWGPRSVVAAVEVLARRPLDAPVIATRESRTLQLPAGDARDILEENFGLLRAALRGLADRLPAVPAACIPLPLPDPLGFVERVMILRGQLMFAGARLDALAGLAHGSHEVRFRPGMALATGGEPALASFVILDGVASGPRGELGPGDAIGVLETLAELPYPETIDARTSLRALETGAPAIFDVLEDHPDLGVAMLAGLASALAGARV